MSADRPKLAAVVTAYFKYAHAQHIVDRFLYGYGWRGTHYHPPMDLVSLYVDQVGEGDLSRSRAAHERAQAELLKTAVGSPEWQEGRLAVERAIARMGAAAKAGVPGAAGGTH